MAPYQFITAKHYAITVHAVIVRPSQSVVTSRHCTKRAKHRITQTMPYDSPEFSYAKDLGEIPTGSSPTGAPNRVGVG